MNISFTTLPYSSALIYWPFRIDMYSIQSMHVISSYLTSLTPIIDGTARDVSFLIDFIPAYLYPSAERTISTWGVAGISLGGHSTWISLSNGEWLMSYAHLITENDYDCIDRPKSEDWHPHCWVSWFPHFDDRARKAVLLTHRAAIHTRSPALLYPSTWSGDIDTIPRIRHI